MRIGIGIGIGLGKKGPIAVQPKTRFIARAIYSIHIYLFINYIYVLNRALEGNYIVLSILPSWALPIDGEGEADIDARYCLLIAW